jgi:RHS repeat-associated protein
VGGSFARTGLPGAVSSATYDAANELLNWNGIALTYDANGNTLSDGANAFTWDARNQLASLNGRNLQYDANGRRIQNLLGTSFLYDGDNIAQEISGGTVSANLLSGGIDEVFSRTDSSGAFTQLKDALGSTVALVDSSGNVQTSYTYDPFGNTSVSGTGNANAYQYTGRENENNGLYFYRARYYSSLLGRFINEDPLGFAGSGANLYAYVFNDPTNLNDPLGLSPGGSVGAPVLEPPVVAPAPPEIPLPVPKPPVPPSPLGPPGALPFCAVNPEVCIGAVGAVGAGATGAIIYYGGSATAAALNANAADAELTQAEHNLNQIYLARSLAGRNCSNEPTEEDCDELYEVDLETCRKLKSRSCYAQAAERWAACKAGKLIPPFPFRLPN